jgi:hypothetical protein
MGCGTSYACLPLLNLQTYLSTKGAPQSDAEAHGISERREQGSDAPEQQQGEASAKSSDQQADQAAFTRSVVQTEIGGVAEGAGDDASDAAAAQACNPQQQQ